MRFGARLRDALALSLYFDVVALDAHANALCYTLCRLNVPALSSGAEVFVLLPPSSSP